VIRKAAPFLSTERGWNIQRAASQIFPTPLALQAALPHLGNKRSRSIMVDVACPPVHLDLDLCSPLGCMTWQNPQKKNCDAILACLPLQPESSRLGMEESNAPSSKGAQNKKRRTSCGRLCLTRMAAVAHARKGNRQTQQSSSIAFARKRPATPAARDAAEDHRAPRMPRYKTTRRNHRSR